MHKLNMRLLIFLHTYCVACGNSLCRSFGAEMLCCLLLLLLPQKDIHDGLQDNNVGVLTIVIWSDEAQADGAGRHMLRPVWCTTAGWGIEKQSARDGAVCLGMMPRVQGNDALQAALAPILEPLKPYLYEGKCGDEGRCACSSTPLYYCNSLIMLRAFGIRA